MATVNDQIITKLTGLGYSGSINNMLHNYWAFTNSIAPASFTSTNDFRRYNKTLADGLASLYPKDVLP